MEFVSNEFVTEFESSLSFALKSVLNEAKIASVSERDFRAAKPLAASSARARATRSLLARSRSLFLLRSARILEEKRDCSQSMHLAKYFQFMMQITT